MRSVSPIAVGGTLLSSRAAAEWLTGRDANAHAAAAARVSQWAADAHLRLGPSAGRSRLLASLEELFEHGLGFECRRVPHSVAIANRAEPIVLTSVEWGRPLTLESRDVLRIAAATGAGWAAGFNGAGLGLADTRPGVPRRSIWLSIDDLANDSFTASLAAALLEADAFASGALPEAIAFSDRFCHETRAALRQGVQTSLAAFTTELPFDASLTVLFRLLFVLFAEARSLVPTWHRLYRDHYSLAGLAPGGIVREARGTWAALEGSRRLLGAGCRAASLQVSGFNGRLFAAGPPRKWASSPLLDSRLDRPAATALAALMAFRPARGGARQVNYAELDVEELGSIYERVLDLDPAAKGRARKESGSFYTPRSLTDFIARRSLSPLVSGRTSEQILELRIVDPAMGSGAFLVAALRCLASALERALIHEGELPEHDVTERDRQQLRRLVAQRCLYGVDANPMAVMLAKLSLWLATLSAGKPLGFLDHRLKCGNSLIGADPSLLRHPPGRAPVHRDLPLFDADTPARALRDGAVRAVLFAGMEENSLEQVRRKQRAFESASDEDAMARWRALADLWCSQWFRRPSTRPDNREYRALADAMVRGTHLLSRATVARRLREASDCAARERFFHWTFEFPDVFAGESPGFDAVLGNPPWEMLRAGSGSSTRDQLKSFVRESGAYTLAGAGHVNLYQLFVERALALTRPGGRIGLVVPWGLFTDDGSSDLRRALLEGASVETLARFDNRDGAFEAHRSLRFAALTGVSGESTRTFEVTRIACHAQLDDLPDAGPPGHGPTFTAGALRTITRSPRGTSANRVPDVADDRQLAVLLKIASRHRGLGDSAGWGASFGRELNLTDDRRAFGSTGMPVIEGKHLHPFNVDTRRPRYRITAAAAARLLPARPFDRPRLAYRDVTAPTNRQTLIAAIVPAGVVTGHSLFCLRNPWDLATQRALCLILNSNIANFLIRMFVSSHVTTSLIEWLPVPDCERAVPALKGVRGAAAAEVIAELYGLAQDELEAI